MTQEERDEILLGLKVKVDKLDEKSTKTDEMLLELKEKSAKTDKILLELKDKVNSLENKVDALGQELAYTKDKVDIIDARTNRMDAMLLEQDDRIRILFDGYKSIQEKFKSQEKWLKSVDESLDNHRARIFKLEKICN